MMLSIQRRLAAAALSIAVFSVAAGFSSAAETGREDPVSFRNEVQAVLARHGCSMGACHGALAGKGGFRLSLRGYDAFADYHAIVEQARGRRVDLANPGLSLLLTKPSAAVPHKGGLRLPVDSADYQLLARWIAQGAPGPREDDSRLDRISVSPEDSLLKIGDTADLKVTALYSNGHQRDVTAWAKFTSTDEAIAAVDEMGHVRVIGPGEGAVLVWFDSKVQLARITAPFEQNVAPETYADAPRANFIDDLNLRQLETLHLAPSKPAEAETFLRRATLDAIGRLPTMEEREDYLADPSPQAKAAMIDRLLSSSDFVDHWTYRLSDVFLISGTKLRPAAVKAYYQWLHTAVAENRPWNSIVRDVLTAQGSSTQQGQTNFYALFQTPEDMSENASQAFMGLSIGCAKCHNHPLEKWTNDQYYAMANMFARVRAKGWGGDSRNGDGIRTVYVASEGELLQPGSGQPQPPAPLDGEPLSLDDPSDRRIALADWMTSPENPYFARAITNRVWAAYFGRGLVEQVDDLRLSNPASNEPMLAAASQYLIDNGFDLRRLMRAILLSETYGRSSEPNEFNADDTKYHSRYYPKRLMAEVLLDAIDATLGTRSTFDKIAFAGADKQKTDFYPAGTRALQLYDSAVDSYFLDTFGRNPREIVCECERSSEPSLVQVLHLSNGETLNPKLDDAENRIHQLLNDDRSTAEIIDQLYLVALSRLPTDTEREQLLEVCDEYDDRETAIKDVAWSLLSSAEFLFNH